MVKFLVKVLQSLKLCGNIESVLFRTPSIDLLNFSLLGENRLLNNPLRFLLDEVDRSKSKNSQINTENDI